MGLAPCTSILPIDWPPSRSCDSIPTITTAIENIIDWLCDFVCAADEIKCVACGVAPPYNALWPDCLTLDCGAMVVELCAAPVLWVWDGTIWIALSLSIPTYNLDSACVDDNDFVTTPYAPTAAWKSYPGVTAATVTVSVPVAAPLSMVQISMSNYQSFTGGTYITNRIRNSTTGWNSHQVSLGVNGPKSLTVFDPAPAVGNNVYILQTFEVGGVVTANAHGFVMCAGVIIGQG